MFCQTGRTEMLFKKRRWILNRVVVIYGEVWYHLIEYKFEENRSLALLAYIKGTAVYADQENIVIDNHGMGYQVKVTSSACEKVHMGEEVTLFTYLYVREDLLALYGFLTREELRLFQILLSVNGIGPKVALSVLSTLTVEDLYYAVIGEDVKSIARTPGIGPKGARRMIIELKDKLDLQELGIGMPDSERTTGNLLDDSGGASAVADTIEALETLGYSIGDAYRAVHKVSGADSLDAEILLKEALKIMMMG